MKRAGFILLVGLLLGGAAYLGLYRAGTSCCSQMMRSERPELAWLKEEFHLSDAEYSRIQKLHDSYLEGCAERCRQIDQKHSHLRHLLASTNTVTPEISQLLHEAALLRAECQRQMLLQFFEVSRTMPLEQGRRYLAWVQAKTIHSDAHSQMGH
jgi:hypothetical protein